MASFCTARWTTWTGLALHLGLDAEHRVLFAQSIGYPRQDS